MKISKDDILEHLRGKGMSDQADKAATELPDQVDTEDDAHKGLLSKFGADAGELKDKLGGLGKF